MQSLLYLLCPLMMVICMVGLLKGGKKETNTKPAISTSQDINNLKNQMENMIEQNKHLTEEVKNLQFKKSNVIDFEQESKNSSVS